MEERKKEWGVEKKGESIMKERKKTENEIIEYCARFPVEVLETVLMKAMTDGYSYSRSCEK